MKTILFTGKNCPKCPKAKEILREVAKSLNLEEGRDYEILDIGDEENMITALQYQIASTPSFVINGKAKFIGEIPSKDELLKEIKNAKE